MAIGADRRGDLLGANLRISGDIGKPHHSHSRFAEPQNAPVGWTSKSVQALSMASSWTTRKERADLEIRPTVTTHRSALHATSGRSIVVQTACLG